MSERARGSVGPLDWTRSPAKWGAVGVLTMLGAGGLAWSVIRAESRSPSAISTRVRPAPESVGVPAAASPGDREQPSRQAAPVAVDGVAHAFFGPVFGGEAGAEASPTSATIEPGTPAAARHAQPPATPPEVPASVADSGGIAQHINLNTATEAELQVLPGIGPARASAIIADRQANGPFRSVDDLDRVRGIGAGIVDGLREFARVR